MLIDILGGEAEFLVEDFVGCGETEGIETPDGAVLTYETFEGAGQAGGHTETLNAFRKDSVLVFFGLLTEETFGRHADNLEADTLFTEELGAT